MGHSVGVAASPGVVVKRLSGVAVPVVLGLGSRAAGVLPLRLRGQVEAAREVLPDLGAEVETADHARRGVHRDVIRDVVFRALYRELSRGVGLEPALDDARDAANLSLGRLEDGEPVVARKADAVTRRPGSA